MISRIKKWKKTNIVFAFFIAISFGLPIIFDAKLRSDAAIYIGLISLLIFYAAVIYIIDYLINIKREVKETKEKIKEAKVIIKSAVEDTQNEISKINEDYKNEMKEIKKAADRQRVGIKKADQEKIKKDAGDLDLEL